MQITRNTSETAAGPSDWFTGAVYVDTVAAPSGASRLSASSVHFTPGARTAWHTHPGHVARGGRRCADRLDCAFARRRGLARHDQRRLMVGSA